MASRVFQVKKTILSGLVFKKCKVEWLEMIRSWFYKIFACGRRRVPPRGPRSSQRTAMDFGIQIPTHPSRTAMRFLEGHRMSLVVKVVDEGAQVKVIVDKVEFVLEDEVGFDPIKAEVNEKLKQYVSVSSDRISSILGRVVGLDPKPVFPPTFVRGGAYTV
ncbi:hypothetical protein E3N88_09137 [Mikania micrantha]|uniref:Uncharacterized protein n=1 Tax=Mikania micrantha TaxID=192012 RepID=A0A5N6PK78_9ASTR|nr:hypothetical protein E3N88_09137 [Mikania micrantha]